eukprot:9413044-Lingulodinium_polyedra.AAC.1
MLKRLAGASLVRTTAKKGLVASLGQSCAEGPWEKGPWLKPVRELLASKAKGALKSDQRTSLMQW